MASHLPRFSFDVEVTAESGREDKVEVEIGEWTLRGTTENLDQIRNFMGPLPKEHQHDENALSFFNLCFGRIFKRPNQKDARRYPMEVRKTALKIHGQRVAGVPLFSGKWMFAFNSNASDEEHEVKTMLRLSLNPIRFARHQRPPQELPPLTSRHWPAPNLEEREDVGSSQIEGEHSLDEETNWMPNIPRRLEYTNDERWPRQLRRYFNGIVEKFEGDLQRASQNADIQPIIGEQNIRLRTVETVWEFRATDPIGLVHTLRPLLEGLSAAPTTTSIYRVLVSGRVVNSPCVEVPLGENCFLRVYGKTNKRVRFEVVHRKIKQGQLIGDLAAPGGTPRNRRYPWDAFSVALDRIREQAAEKLNGVFRFLRERGRVVESEQSGVSLIMAIRSAAQNEAQAHLIFSALVYQSGVRKTGTALTAVLKRLKQAGVLAYNSGTRTYDVTPAYYHAIATLRSPGVAAALGIIEPTQPPQPTRRRRRGAQS